MYDLNKMSGLIKQLQDSIIPGEQTEILKELVTVLCKSHLQRKGVFVLLQSSDDPKSKYNIRMEQVTRIEKNGQRARVTLSGSVVHREPIEVIAPFGFIAKKFELFLIRINKDLLISPDLIDCYKDTGEVVLTDGTSIFIQEGTADYFEYRLTNWGNFINTDDDGGEEDKDEDKGDDDLT